MTYLLTFSCYGTHLHGDERGSVDRHTKTRTARERGPEPGLEAFETSELQQPPYSLDAQRRKIVLQAIREVCHEKGWPLLALHVRTEHLHAVVDTDLLPARVAQQLKAYSSKALNLARIDSPRRIRWTRGFSVRGLFTPEARTKAVRYVVEQGEPMALYVAPGERAPCCRA